MRDLHTRLERAVGMDEHGGRGQADGHPLCEERRPAAAREEEAPWSLDDAELLRDGGEHVLERAAARPPELVSVAADDPIGAVLFRRPARHRRPPLSRPKLLALLADELENAVALVRLEDLGSAVPRAMVDRDYEVDPRVEVERDDGVDHVRLIPGEEGQDQLHRRRRRVESQAVKRA